MGRERELRPKKERKDAYLGHIFSNSKNQFLNRIMEGMIEWKEGLGERNTLWLKNIRDLENLDTHALSRAAQDRKEYA